MVSSFCSRLFTYSCRRLLRRRLSSSRESYKRSPLTVLGIESSCDDTGAAVVTDNGHILGEALHSQLAVHNKTGGIVPTVAADLHRENIEGVVQTALDRSGCGFEDVSVVAVTTGPGLALCLMAGLNFAKQLVRQINKPLLSVHHMEAHALTARMETDIPFPYLVLLVSGGHCILATTKGVGQFSRLGQTGDDSPGEAFDKIARWMRLDLHDDVGHMSGGVAIETLARGGDPDRFKLPQVMVHSRCCNFSFSGLKTAARKHIARVSLETGWSGDSPMPGCEHMSASFQQAISTHLLTRTHRAILYCQREVLGISNLVVSGGVASNKYIRSSIEDLAVMNGFKVHFPSPHLCTDNGAMIAWAGVEYLRQENGMERFYEVERLDELDFTPRWPLGDDLSQRVIDMNISVRKQSRKH